MRARSSLVKVIVRLIGGVDGGQVLETVFKEACLVSLWGGPFIHITLSNEQVLEAIIDRQTNESPATADAINAEEMAENA